jgi:hypothetical protein
MFDFLLLLYSRLFDPLVNNTLIPILENALPEESQLMTLLLLFLSVFPTLLLDMSKIPLALLFVFFGAFLPFLFGTADCLWSHRQHFRDAVVSCARVHGNKNPIFVFPEMKLQENIKLNNKKVFMPHNDLTW